MPRIRPLLAAFALAGFGLAAALALSVEIGPAQPIAQPKQSLFPDAPPSELTTGGPSSLAVGSTIPSARPPVGLEVGELAPDFTLPSLVDGTPISLSSFAGHPVWLHFWAPSCPSCIDEMPRMEGMWLHHQAAGLVILGVGIRDSPELMRQVAQAEGVDYPMVVDTSTVAARYQVIALPAHFWIDRSGLIRGRAFGELPPEILAARLAELMADDGT